MNQMSTSKKWYVVHTYSGSEEKARQGLQDRIKAQHMEGRFGQIFVPRTASETVLKSGKKKRVEKTSFPGYILVEMDFDDATSLLVRETPKITGFVGNAKTPRPMSDAEVLRLTSPEAVEAQKVAVAAEVSFRKGESVKVKEGPFTNFDGIVDEVRADKMKLRILVSIFGRETPVELDYIQVEKIG
jgi:transcription termination/antitermination protein NusG